jgi:hypothetical protein
VSLKPGRWAWALAGGFVVGGFFFAIASPTTRLLGFIWLGVGLCVLALFGLFAYNDHRARELRRSGIPGVAVIKSMSETGTEINGQPVMNLELEVRPEGLPVYTVRKRLLVLMDEAGVGSEVPVFVDRSEPQELVVDWGAM